MAFIYEVAAPFTDKDDRDQRYQGAGDIFCIRVIHHVIYKQHNQQGKQYYEEADPLISDFEQNGRF